MPVTPDCLHLNIISCSCRCGNKWTHSHPWLSHSTAGYLGGTPSPQQEEKLHATSYENTRWTVSHCFRCVPLQLGVGWTKPTPVAVRPSSSPAASMVQAASDDELLA